LVQGRWAWCVQAKAAGLDANSSRSRRPSLLLPLLVSCDKFCAVHAVCSMSPFVVTSVLIKSAVGKGPIHRANAAGEADGDAVAKFVNDKYKYTIEHPMYVIVTCSQTTFEHPPYVPVNK
jgi:hypothetical protein